MEPVATPTGRSSMGKLVLWMFLPLLIGATVFAWAWMEDDVLADPGVVRVNIPVPAFSLTERSGDTVVQSDLLGKVWVANFIFARCPGPCPKLSARMSSLQRSLKDRADEVRLVSFSVDPVNDTPAALRHYAKRFKADASMWLFLTGKDRDAVYELIVKGFLLAVIPATEDEPLAHSNFFVIVDREGNIRAYHDGLQSGATKRILQDVNQLLRTSEPV